MNVCITATAVVVLYLCSQTVAQSGVCYQTSSRSVSDSCSFTEVVSRLGSYKTSCGWFRKCRRYYTYYQSRIAYQVCYRTEYSAKFACCAGWEQEGFTCRLICENGGTNVQRDECQCLAGWTGKRCTIPICSPECENGTCVQPDVCLCNTGWTGPTCAIAICSSECENGGRCILPNTCQCDAGWTLPTCSIAICSPECVNGTCVQPGICRCNAGWTGPTCEDTEDPDEPRILCLHPTGLHNLSPEPLNVTIGIQYTPPSDVSFRPPNYRAATPVILTCKVEGAVGTDMSYRWTSTNSLSFVTNGNAQRVVQSRLFSTDAGVCTCTAFCLGNSGSASMEMNIIGAGIYAYNSEGSNYIALPDNGMIVSQDCCQRFNFYCQSNSTSTEAGQLIGDYSSLLTTSYCGPGCCQVYTYSTWTSSYQGVYTCRIPDSNGMVLDINVGLYPYGFHSAPRVTSLQCTSTSTHFILTCTSTDSAATSVTWVKDGINLAIDGTNYQIIQTVTHRRYSTYTNTLVSTRNLDSMVGDHVCIVSNSFGSSSLSIAIAGLRISGIEHPFVLGDVATLTCSGDLHVSRIQWLFRRGRLSIPLATSTRQSLTLVFYRVTLSMHGVQYTCRVTSPCGIQERTATIVTLDIDPLAIVEVFTVTTEPPTEGHDFVLICTVTINTVMMTDLDVTVHPTLEWVDPSDAPVLSEGHIAVGNPTVDENKASRTLSFTPLSSSDGGTYTCRAAVNVPELSTTLSKSTTIDLVVGSGDG